MTNPYKNLDRIGRLDFSAIDDETVYLIVNRTKKIVRYFHVTEAYDTDGNVVGKITDGAGGFWQDMTWAENTAREWTWYEGIPQD